MLSTPTITFCERMPYVAIRTKVHQPDIPATLPPLLPKVYWWIEQNDITCGGPPFFLYRSIDSDNMLVAEVGVPVAADVFSNGHVFSDALPEGHYASIRHMGNYETLMDGHIALETWLSENGLQGKHRRGSYGTVWYRAEFYLNNPDEEPDPSKRITEIVMLLDTE